MLPPVPSGYWKQIDSSVDRPGASRTKRTSMPAAAISRVSAAPSASWPTRPTGNTWKGVPEARAPSSSAG